MTESTSETTPETTSETIRQTETQHEDLTAAEAARRIGVSSLHVIDLLEAGALDFHMVGEDILFDAADVANYKAGRAHADQEHLVGA